MKRVVVVVIISMITYMLSAQELRCNVTVSASALDGSTRARVAKLGADVERFMNTAVWTDLNISSRGKINCNIFINIESSPSTDNYTGSIGVLSSRPIFGTSIESNVLNISDPSISFEYDQYSSIDYSETSIKNELSTVLAFYAYVIIGMDLDSFKQGEGDPIFDKASNVRTRMQNSGVTGWSSSDGSRSRYSLVTDLLDIAYEPFRKLVYDYHIKGIDLVGGSIFEARAGVAESLKQLELIKLVRSDAYLIDLFLDAKIDEITELYRGAEKSELVEIYDQLKDVHPTYAHKFKNSLL